MWRAEEKSQLVPVSPPRCWYIVLSAQDWIKHSTFFLFFFSQYYPWKKQKITATLMKHVHLRQGRKDFIGWSTQQPYFKSARNFEGAVGMKSEDKCLTSMRNRGRARSEVQGVKLSPAEIPGALAVGRSVPPWESTKVLGVPDCWACLSPWVVFPRCGERNGTMTLSRLASTYPNPLLFQGLRVLAVLLIPPAPFFLWLLMFERIGLCITRDFLQSAVFLGHSGQICSNGSHICAIPLTWPQWVSIPFCCLLYSGRAALLWRGDRLLFRLVRRQRIC